MSMSGSRSYPDHTTCQKLSGRLKYTQRCLLRTKQNKQIVDTNTDLSRCLTTFDLTNLGIGSILGAGIYVVAGQVATTIAGPSIVLSFTIAAFASLLSGLCYAEFGSRVPHTTGSAYAYSYHTVGELLAFIIGWNLVLEYMIGTAADARALSSAFDYLMDHRLRNFSLTHIGRVPQLNSHVDLLAFALTILVTVVLAVGVKESARYSTIFNVLNGAVAVLVIVIGSTKAKAEYWKGPDKFFPHGAKGVFAGAAACFYAFIGFDIIATTGEEARTASKSIPKAVAISLAICYVLYIGVSTVLTMMVPFNELHSSSPLTEAFDHVGVHWAKWLVGFGSVFGLSASLLGSEFPLPRIIYAMAVDGLLFKFFRQVSSRTETPVIATLIPGLLTAFFSMLFDLRELVEMMSIGTLLAYSLVCTSVLLLRYRPHNNMGYTTVPLHNLNSEDQCEDSQPLLDEEDNNATLSRLPNERSSRLVVILTIVMWVLSAVLSIVLIEEEKADQKINIPVIIFSVAVIIAIVVCIIVVWCQPQDSVSLRDLHFKVPLVPLLPMATIFINVFLMMRLSNLTWIRFAVWMTIGMAIYFFYGIHHSEESTEHQFHGPDVGATTPLMQPGTSSESLASAADGPIESQGWSSSNQNGTKLSASSER